MIVLYLRNLGQIREIHFRLRTALYRLCGFRIGANSLILGKMELVGKGNIWEKLQIGEICQINGLLYADLNAPITIGHHVSLGHHVVLITTEHLTNFPHHRCGPGRPAPIVLEDGCWIGARATILPGVTVGKGSVVSAGAVVFADVPPQSYTQGLPNWCNSSWRARRGAR